MAAKKRVRPREQAPAVGPVGRKRVKLLATPRWRG
jgi:hypothetical protein